MAEDESNALLEFLFRHVSRPEFQVRFNWRRIRSHSGQSLHAAFGLWDYWPNERYGHRVTVKGDRPFFKARSG